MSYRVHIERTWTVASTDGVDLTVYDLGGAGPVLLITHATGFCGPCYGPLAEALSEEFHCFALDFRAHGASTQPSGEMIWSGMAEDVLAVAAEIGGGDPIYGVGHSMGGASLVLAETTRPGTLHKGWAFEPILFSRAEGRHPSFMSDGARKRRPRFNDRQEAFDRFVGRPPLSRLDRRALRAYVDHGLVDSGDDDGSVVLGCAPEDEASVFEYHNAGARDAAGELTIPFAVAASGDGQRPAVAVTETAAEHTNLDLVVYDDLDHFGPLAAPDRLAPDIADYLLG